LVLDPGVENSQAEEKTSAKKKKAGSKDQGCISIGEGGDANKDERKDKTEQNVDAPKDKLFLTE
jgi:hypothetical protein